MLLTDPVWVYEVKRAVYSNREHCCFCFCFLVVGGGGGRVWWGWGLGKSGFRVMGWGVHAECRLNCKLQL